MGTDPFYIFMEDPKIHSRRTSSCSSFCSVLLRFPTEHIDYLLCCAYVCTTMDGSTTMVVKVFQSHFPETIDPYHFSNTLITPLSAPTTPKLHIKYPFLRNSQVLTPQISISQKSLLQFPFFQKHVEDAQVKVVPFLQP